MFSWRKKLKNIIILSILIMMLCFLGVDGNGQTGNTNFGIGEEDNITTENSAQVVDIEPEKTNLDVYLIDNINSSKIKMTNCILVLAGEMRIAEDIFTYNNTFLLGDVYKITVLIELKDTEQK